MNDSRLKKEIDRIVKEFSSVKMGPRGRNSLEALMSVAYLLGRINEAVETMNKYTGND